MKKLFAAGATGYLGGYLVEKFKTKGLWVRDSLTSCSNNTGVQVPRSNRVGRYFRELGYGYQWWSADIGNAGWTLPGGTGDNSSS